MTALAEVREAVELLRGQAPCPECGAGLPDVVAVADRGLVALGLAEEEQGVLREMIEGFKGLLTAYRLGDHVRADRALGKIEKAETALARLEERHAEP